MLESFFSDNAIVVPYLYLAIGLVALIISGNYLVTGSVQLARHFKISTLVVGLTIVAYGTSAPEMFISVKAALNDAHDIALGNVIGSNIANIGFILAVVAMICPIPIRNRSIGIDFSIMFIITALLLLFGYNGIIGRLEGIFLVVILAVYTVWSVVKSRKQLKSTETEPATLKPHFSILMIILSIGGLYFSSGWFVEGARGIALHWGVSERVIAISIVAVGTSMPELVASLVAAFRKEGDLSVGNIIGSNLFNIAGVLAVSSIVRPINIGSHSLFISDMIWLFGITVLFFLTMIPLSKGKIRRWESAVLLSVFSVYIFRLYTAG